MIGERLKIATAVLHRNVEQILLSDKILSGTLTLADYRFLVQTLYTFHARYEDAVMEFASLLVGEECLTGRRKKVWLEQDAERLGIDPEPAKKADLNPASATGWLYVMEGATLGGQVIERHLNTNAVIAATGASRYYRGYGTETGRYWKAFRETIDNLPLNEEDCENVIGGANAAYARLIELGKELKPTASA